MICLLPEDVRQETFRKTWSFEITRYRRWRERGPPTSSSSSFSRAPPSLSFVPSSTSRRCSDSITCKPSEAKSGQVRPSEAKRSQEKSSEARFRSPGARSDHKLIHRPRIVLWYFYTFNGLFTEFAGFDVTTFGTLRQ